MPPRIPFKFDVPDGCIYFNNQPVAKLLSIGNDEKNPSRWKLEFIPIDDQGHELQDVNIQCSFGTISKGKYTMIGTEVNRKLEFHFKLIFNFIGNFHAVISGQLGNKVIPAKKCHTPTDAVAMLTQLFKNF